MLAFYRSPQARRRAARATAAPSRTRGAWPRSAWTRAAPSSACRAGFSAALERAKAVAVVDEFVHEQAAFTAPDGTGQKKKKISVKKAPDAQESKVREAV